MTDDLIKIDIKSMSLSELENEIENLSVPKFHAKQIYKWLHKGIKSFSNMTDVSADLRSKLEKRYYIAAASIENKLVSIYDDTRKYLLKFNDGEYVEAVLMKYKYGYSICISTQVGCKMGCSFCATGKDGFIRNLKSSEMISQIQAIGSDVSERISNVVLMGMGEPLDNYENVLRFLELVSSKEGINIGVRHISLSTCGIVDKIYDLAQRKMGITLSVSLHAPNDELRSKIMKINNRFCLEDLVNACRFYAMKTGRRISYEYAMISGVNDTETCAYELSKLLKNELCHVNLIPVNEVKENFFKKSSKNRINLFKSILEKNKINVTVRRTLGSDINASCGQLRRHYIKKGEGQLGNMQ